MRAYIENISSNIGKTRNTSNSGPMIGLAKDKEVKDAVLASAIERFEITSYMKLIAAAEATGHESVTSILEESLREARAMEHEFENDLPTLVKRYIEKTPEE